MSILFFIFSISAKFDMDATAIGTAIFGAVDIAMILAIAVSVGG